MSTDEENAAIAALVRQRAESKRRLALLANELESAGEYMHEVGDALRFAFRSPSGSLDHISPLIEKHPESVDLSRVEERFKEYFALRETLSVLDSRAREIGID